MGPRRRGSQARQLLEASAIGLMFPIAIAIGFGWGFWMDRLFGTWPWLTVIFTAFGVAAAFVNLFRMASGDDGDVGGTG
ncbi:MAG TPA: AtpZ/AtpI family protein [Thermoanaerobaculia bacterium]|nr:AtpZ/AtpI family protein [Thermoanaerobaculia bacterium]